MFAVFSAAGFAAQYSLGAHSHVFSLLLEKIRFFGVRPDDPTLLPFEARVLWTRDFDTPPPDLILILCSTSLLFGLIGLAGLLPRILRRRATPDQILIAYHSLITFVMFLMFRRMVPFTIFSLALLGGMVWPQHIRWRRVGFIVLFISSLTFEIIKYHYIKPEATRQPTIVSHVTRFLRSQTNPNDAVVSSMEMGGPIAAYSNRPVLIHSKFESHEIRQKVERIYRALYEDEEKLFELCEYYDAKYLVYQTDMALPIGSRSILYAAGYRTLSTKCAAFLLHFAPEKLRCFQLLAQNANYRIFRIEKSLTGSIPSLPYYTIYDLSFFVHGEPGETISQAEMETGLAKLELMHELYVKATELHNTGQLPQAISVYQGALKIHPKQPDVLLGYAKALAGQGKFQRAAEALVNAVTLDSRLEPDYSINWPPDVLITFAMAEYLQNEYDKAERLCKRILAVNKDSWRANLYLGLSLFNQDRMAEAKQAFRETIRLNPKCSTAHQYLGMM
jgi:tetratricopeptide (TPR) repeat protein